MQYDKEVDTVDLIDLGVATEEVKGAISGQFDLTGGLKPVAGLSDD